MSRNSRINHRAKKAYENSAKSRTAEQIYGFHPVVAALKNPARRNWRLLLTPEVRNSPHMSELESGAKESRTVARQEIDAMLPPGAIHQGLLLECAPLPPLSLNEACTTDGDRAPILLLDQVSDPQNVGAILRSAAAFGARAIVLQERHSPAATGAMAKAASGALETVPVVRVTNLSRAMGQLQDMGYWLIGLESDAEMQLSAELAKHPVALVLGAEGSGLRRLTRENCDILASIKLANSMHSLNVSNAAAVALYQLTIDMNLSII